MAQQDISALEQAIERLEKAMILLENAIAHNYESQCNSFDLEEEVQRMNADRSRLAQELDASESRNERLEQANKEVSRRLINAMETIRTVVEE